MFNKRLFGQSGDREITLPSVRVYRSTTQVISTGALNAYSYDSVSWDYAGGVWKLADPTKVYVRYSGIWIATGVVNLAANATGERSLNVRDSGGILRGGVSQPSPSAANDTRLGLPGVPLYLKAGQWVEMVVFQNSGGNLDAAYNSDYTGWFSLCAQQLFT